MNVRKVVMSALVVFAAAAPATAATATAAKAPVKITVTAKEYSFHLTKQGVPAGTTVMFTVQNKGQLRHDFVFQTLHKGTKLLNPGQKATFKVVFKKAGRYTYLCTVPLHANEGMEGTFVVKK